jgi:hypothetical protein
VPSRAEEYRKRADECRAQAARASDEEQRRQYLAMADGWLKLAEHAEQRDKKSDEKK